MVYSLAYRRPPHVDSARSSIMGDKKPKSIGASSIDSAGTGVSVGIPNALSFDRIITGGTCPVSKFLHTFCKAASRSRGYLIICRYAHMGFIPIPAPLASNMSLHIKYSLYQN